MFGWRGRIGLLVPSSNTTMEMEFAGCLPQGVSLHTARLPLIEVTAKGLEEMVRSACIGAKALADANVDVIVFGCTTGSLILGVEHMIELASEIERTAGVSAIMVAKAVVDIIRENGGKKIVVATPYVEELNEREKRFLIANGIDVLAIVGLGLSDNREIGKQEPYVAYRLAKKLFAENPDADLVFISCTNFRTFGMINLLTAETQKPVVTSNQAALIQALRVLQIPESTIKEIINKL